MNFIMLVGLPGSGKTYFGNSLGLLFFDDLTQNGGLDAIKGKIPEGYLLPVVISDFSFIFEQARNLAMVLLLTEFPDSKFQWVSWENDLEACIRNVKRRADGRVISEDYMRVISAMYTYPNSISNPRQVYNPH